MQIIYLRGYFDKMMGNLCRLQDGVTEYLNPKTLVARLHVPRVHTLRFFKTAC